jgi:hypothetical protein
MRNMDLCIRYGNKSAVSSDVSREKKRPQMWRNTSWFLHLDNVPAHASLLIHKFLANTNTTVLPQPPYSPDLVPADFFLFPKEIHFERTAISNNSRDYPKFADGVMRDPKKKVYQDCFQKWQWCWEWCINAGGEYSVAGMSKTIIKK